MTFPRRKLVATVSALALVPMLALGLGADACAQSYNEAPGLAERVAAANRPVLAENRETGGYEFVEASWVGGVNMIINVNLTHKDLELRELFNTRDFRVALSLGMDLQSIIDTAFLGDGEPWQQGPFEDHPRLN